MKKVLVGVVIVALALGLVGCKSIEDKVAEEVSEGIVGGLTGSDVEVDGDAVTIETEDGSVTLEGDTGQIPEDFPSDFPIYDGIEVDSTSTISGDTDTSFYINLVSEDDVKDIYDWYKSEFAAEGWEITGDVMMTGSGDDSAMLSVEKGDMQGTLTAVASDTGADIGIILVITK